jgi:hypothetical protein
VFERLLTLAALLGLPSCVAGTRFHIIEERFILSHTAADLANREISYNLIVVVERLRANLTQRVPA